MYNDNNRKLRTILLVLAIVLVLLRIVNTAKAHELPDDAYDDVVGFYDSYFNPNYKAYLTNSLEICPYFVHFHFHSGYYERYIIILFSNEDMGLNFIANTGYVNGAGNSVYRDVNGVRQQSTAFTRKPDFNLGSSGYIRLFYCSNKQMTPYISAFDVSAFDSNWLVRPSSSYALITSQVDLLGNNFNIASGTFNDITSFGNVYIQTALDSYVYHETDYTAYTDDSRLKFWKFNNLDGSETLVTDLSDFLQGSEGVMTNEVSGLTLTYELDNVEHTLALDSSNSVVRRSGTATTYRVETPFSAFGFDSSVTSFNITKCDFTLTYSAYGYTTSENYKISCNYPAFRQSSPVDPEAVPTPGPVYTDPAPASVISDRIDSIFNNLQSSVTGSDLDYVLEYPNLPDWANVYNVNTFVFGDVGSYYGPYYYKGSQILWKYHDDAYLFDIEQFIYDNAVSSFYDVIIIRIDDTEWGTLLNNNSIPESTTFLGYVILYTNNYYTRLDAETNINILQAIQSDANQQLENWGWLISRIDDFEGKTLDALNAQLDIDTDSLSWLKTIDNSIKSLDFPVFDDSSIISGLASIVTALSGDNDDLGVNGRLDKLINFFVANEAERNDSALTYRNWLDGLDPTESRRVTHFGTNIYSLVKNIFDVFDADYTENPSFENPDKDYLDIASDYIDALNNRNNTNKFFRGFFDSSFDPLEQSGLPEE